MSKEIISYSLCNGTAFDEDGVDVKVEFVVEQEGEFLFGPYATVDGVLCKATDVELEAGLLSFWATPISLGDCLAETERLLQSASQN